MVNGRPLSEDGVYKLYECRTIGPLSLGKKPLDITHIIPHWDLLIEAVCDNIHKRVQLKSMRKAAYVN